MNHSLKTLLLIAALAGPVSSARAVVTLPFYDGFNYTTGSDLAGQGNWVAASGAGTIKVGAAGLSHAALTNGVGKDVTLIPAGTAARTYVNFTSQTSGSVYFSFLLKINSLPSAQSIIGFASGSTSSDTTPSLGFFVKNTTGQLAVGINTSSPQFSSANLDTGQTYLVVVGYTFGTSTDTADVWLNPASLGGPAPAVTGSFTGTHNSSLAYFLWNTPSSGGGSFEVDEFRIGPTYASVTPPASAAPPTVTNSVPRITQTWVSGGNIILRGTNGTPNGGYEILRATDPALPSAQWSVIGSNNFNGLGNFDVTNPLTAGAAGGFYRLRIGGTNVTAAIAPSITNQPQSQTVLAGQDVLFGVGASGTAPLSYRWFFNTNTPIAGATSSSLLVTNVQATNAGGYSVVVTNIAGSVTSVVATLMLGTPPTNGDFYVSTTGNDSNPGTLAAPFATVARAVSVATAGNLIYVRGGSYFPTQTIRITNSGSAGNLIKLWAYPGEKPVLDFTNQPYGGSSRGFLISPDGNYWHFKGLEIARAGDNAIKCEGGHNIFELLVLHHNGDTGLQIGLNKDTLSSNPDPQHWAAYNLTLNCDSYMNYDPDTKGGDADGFACKLYPGAGNQFIGCRGWKNSDDGWDFYLSSFAIVLSNCWTWHNGDASQYTVVGGSYQGNGNGFKLGSDGSEGTHVVMNCVAFNNNFPGRTRHGFDQNHHGGGALIYNCLAFDNLYNYFFEDSVGGNPQIFRNNISLNGAVSDFVGGTVEDHNTWLASDHGQANPAVGSFGAADFSSLAEAAAEAPRNPDGSLPLGFARLLSGSNLIDKGVNVGTAFNGSAPDLGPYEFAP